MRNKFFRKFITVIFLLIYNIEIFAANLVVDPNSNHNTKLDVAYAKPLTHSGYIKPKNREIYFSATLKVKF